MTTNKELNNLIIRFGEIVNRFISEVADKHDCHLTSEDGCKVCESLWEMREEIKNLQEK